MALLVLQKKLTKKDFQLARQDYQFYLKITVDLLQKIVALGGQYHADAEKILVEKFGSLKKNLWGGGFNIKTQKFEANALINLKPGQNESLEILDPYLRQAFFDLVAEKLSNLSELI